MDKYNLKTEYNWRGRVSELLAKFYLSNNDNFGSQIKLTKNFEYVYESFLSKKENDFLKKYWETIDIYGVGLNGLIIYEVKSRTLGVNRKFDITNRTYDMFKSALKLGISLKFVIIYYDDDWEFFIEVKEFDEVKDKLKINDGGYYRR